MSSYTTGEIARLCEVTVRTVQYYDSRGILVPSDFSEGGRRLYTDADVQKLKMICFLRDAGLQINSIREILNAPNSEKVIETILLEQEKQTKAELVEKEKQLYLITNLKKELKNWQDVSLPNLSDIVYFTKNKEKLNRMRGKMLVLGAIMDVIEIVTLILWIRQGIWLPFVLGMCVVVGMGIWISKYYFEHTLYICPECHGIFRPQFKQAFWAYHTPRTRKLTCTQCGHHGFAVETYGEKESASCS